MSPEKTTRKTAAKKNTPLPAIDMAWMEDALAKLLNTPSPTGHTEAAISLLEEILADFPEVKLERTRKGSLLATLPGAKSSQGTTRALTAHVDTLGAMVKRIKSNGRLELTQIGGYAWTSVEGESCLVHTQKNGAVIGSLLPVKASVHVYGAAARDDKRTAEGMEVRLDARVTNEEETRALGIEVGDFVSFDARVVREGGFIRSRHLDDKAAVATLLGAVKALHDAKSKPAVDTMLLFSNFEEVGFGGASDFPAELDELVAVDMAAIGEGQSSDEYHATLCVKDSSGPYHHGLSNKLRALADAQGIEYRVDIYPYYGSDAKAYWSAGGSAAIALIGPGVDSSHHYERTHQDALRDTTRWILAYLLAE